MNAAVAVSLGSRYRAWSENQISHEIISCAIEVYRTLGGPGLLESVYEEALVYEMQERGLCVVRQEQLPIKYKSAFLGAPLRLDLLVEDKVIIECKSVEECNTIYEAQALTYLRLSGKRLALVITSAITPSRTAPIELSTASSDVHGVYLFDRISAFLAFLSLLFLCVFAPLRRI